MVTNPDTHAAFQALANREAEASDQVRYTGPVYDLLVDAVATHHIDRPTACKVVDAVLARMGEPDVIEALAKAYFAVRIGRKLVNSWPTASNPMKDSTRADVRLMIKALKR